MAYRIITVDLSAIVASENRETLVDRNTTISEVVILTLPFGASLSLAFGDNDAIPITGPISFQPRGDDEQRQGLYLVNDSAQPGVTVDVIVAFGAATTGARAA